MAADFGQPGSPAAESRAVGDSRRPVLRLRPRAAAVRPGRSVNSLVLVGADVVALGLAVVVSRRAVLPSAVFGCLVIVALSAGGMYRLRICLRVADQADRVLASVAVPLVIMLPWLKAPPAALLALYSAVAILAARSVVSGALRLAHAHGRLTDPTVVVGAGTFGVHICELMLARPNLGLRPVGFVESGTPRPDLPLPCLGGPDDLPAVVERFGIRRVIICYTACKDEDLVTVLRSEPVRADVCVIPRLYELGFAVPRSSLDELWGIPLIPLRRLAHEPVGRVVKRAFDVTGALVLLAVAAPLLLLLGIAIRLQSGESPLFRQTRVTGSRRATILKLRTLVTDGNPDTSWTVPGHYSTRLGRWLRVTHLDELPQLVNVLRGEMSLVGPRPERPYFADKFGREIARYDDRTRMLAGMTGWAQVHGLHGDTPIVERARFDNQYIEYWSPWLDVVILVRTAAGLLMRLPRSRR